MTQRGGQVTSFYSSNWPWKISTLLTGCFPGFPKVNVRLLRLARTVLIRSETSTRILTAILTFSTIHSYSTGWFGINCSHLFLGVQRIGSRSRTMIHVSWVGTIRCSIRPANCWGPRGLIWWRCRGIVTRVFVAVRVVRACSWRRIWARALMRIGPPRRLLRARRRSLWAARFAIR